MKIIFDSEEQKIAFLETLADEQICPSDARLIDRCGMHTCPMCWEEAVEMEIKKED